MSDRIKDPKSTALYVRMTEAELADIRAAASYADAENISTWCRKVLAREAARAVTKASK